MGVGATMVGAGDGDSHQTSGCSTTGTMFSCTNTGLGHSVYAGEGGGEGEGDGERGGDGAGEHTGEGVGD